MKGPLPWGDTGKMQARHRGTPKQRRVLNKKNQRSGVYGKLKSSTLRSDGNTGSKESHILQDVFIS